MTVRKRATIYQPIWSAYRIGVGPAKPPETGLKVTIERGDMLPHPTFRTMNRSEWAKWTGQYAYYDSIENEVVLTPTCTEGEAVRAVLHELTHWAQYMALTRQERDWEADIYSKITSERSESWMQCNHICERMAYWLEDG